MPTVNRSSYLTVNGVDLATAAYWITNLEPEMLRGPTLRGSDTVIPHATGVYANRRRVTAKVLQFQMIVTGDFTNTGSAASDWRAQILTNVEYLTANLGLAYATGDGTVTATWHRYGGSTKTASVHVQSFETSDLVKRHVAAVLELSVPSGAFS